MAEDEVPDGAIEAFDRVLDEVRSQLRPDERKAGAPPMLADSAAARLAEVLRRMTLTDEQIAEQADYMRVAVAVMCASSMTKV